MLISSIIKSDVFNKLNEKQQSYFRNLASYENKIIPLDPRKRRSHDNRRCDHEALRNLFDSYFIALRNIDLVLLRDKNAKITPDDISYINKSKEGSEQKCTEIFMNLYGDHLEFNVDAISEFEDDDVEPMSKIRNGSEEYEQRSQPRQIFDGQDLTTILSGLSKIRLNSDNNDISEPVSSSPQRSGPAKLKAKDLSDDEFDSMPGKVNASEAARQRRSENAKKYLGESPATLLEGLSKLKRN